MFTQAGWPEKRQPWPLLCYLGLLIDLVTYHKVHIGLGWSKHYLILCIIPSFSFFLSSSLEFLNLREENSFAPIHKLPSPHQILRTFTGIEYFNSTCCFITFLKQRKLLTELAWGVTGKNKGNVKPGFQLCAKLDIMF